MWNGDDVTRVFASQFTPGAERYKFIDLPLSNYASSSARQGHEGRQGRGALDVQRHQLQRAVDVVAGRRGSRYQGWRRADTGLG